MKASIDGLLAALAHSSAAAGVLVLLVLALQALFRPLLSPRWQCALWLIVIARLLPFSLSSDASLFNLLPRWQAFAYPEPPSAATPAKVPASSPLLQISAATSGPTASPTPAPTDAPALTAEHVPSGSVVKARVVRLSGVEEIITAVFNGESGDESTWNADIPVAGGFSTIQVHAVLP